MSNRVNVGIVGTGFVQNTFHMPAYLEIKLCECGGRRWDTEYGGVRQAMAGGGQFIMATMRSRNCVKIQMLMLLTFGDSKQSAFANNNYGSREPQASHMRETSGVQCD